MPVRLVLGPGPHSCWEEWYLEPRLGGSRLTREPDWAREPGPEGRLSSSPAALCGEKALPQGGARKARRLGLGWGLERAQERTPLQQAGTPKCVKRRFLVFL